MNKSKIDTLWEAIQNFNPTEQDREYFKQRMIEMELRFIEEDRNRRVTKEWLDKEYTL
jgi:hypothetical protein